MPPDFIKFFFIIFLIPSTFPTEQNSTEDFNATFTSNFTSELQSSNFLIEINDTIDIDYLMDDSWPFINSSFELIEPSIQLKNLTKAIAKIPRNVVKVFGDDQLHWPNKKEAVMEGDVILGGLMMVHEREDNATCGPIMPQGGIQALEAMMFTLDRINEMKLLKNITIGAMVLDDCDKDTYGLEMAVEFIKGE
jgi:hypothetical protein